MVRVEMIQAGQGDCIWIEYGEESKGLHRILIDGGVSGTYKTLKKRIEALPAEQRHFDLLVITHIDGDHIAGILKLFEDKVLDVSFDDVWFNAYRHLGRESRSKSIRQAEKLSNYLEQASLNWNKAFNGKAVCVDKRKKRTAITLPGGMKITLYSPTKKALSDLKPDWTKAITKAGISPFLRAMETETNEPLTDAMPDSALPDLKMLAERPSDKDSSLTNGSSIAFVASYEERKMLFSGDAHAEILLNSIKREHPDCEPLYLDLFKVPHHGSDGNVTRKLLERIRCSRYLVSTNGAQHHHPDRAAMARLICYGGHQPDIYFNYLSDYTEIWRDARLQKRYRFTAHYPQEDTEGISILFENEKI